MPEADADSVPASASLKRGVGIRAGRGWIWLLRIAVTLAAVAFLVSSVDVTQLGTALRAMPAYVLPLVVLLKVAVMALAALRWRLLMYGQRARWLPPPGELLRLQLVGLFYNTYVPGGVGGDVLRALATRDCFADPANRAGTPTAFTVVLLERVLGLVALVLMVGAVLALHPLDGIGVPWLWAGIGLAAGAAMTLAIAYAGHVAARLPQRLSRWAAMLPRAPDLRAFALALVCALGSHAVVAMMGHVLIRQLDAGVSVWDSLAVVPLASIAAYVPLTVAGVGAVDVALVTLYEATGALRSDALATAMLWQLAKLLVAGAAGILAWVTPSHASARAP